MKANDMSNMNIKTIIDFCVEKHVKNIYLFVHKNPDPDALGSALSLSIIFKSFNFYSKVVICNDYENYGMYFIDKTSYIGMEDFVGIICDCSSMDYIENTLWKKAKYLIKIDHHKQRTSNIELALSFVNEHASSTCEIVLYMIQDYLNDFDKDLYNYLYYGLLTDTGNYSYSINKDKTFFAASEMIKHGADYKELQNKYCLKDRNTLNVHRFILNNMKIYTSNHYKTNVAICVVKQHDIRKYKLLPRAFSKEVNIMKNIEGVGLWATIVEIKKDTFAISIRSNELSNISVESIAREFGGGGHFNSAGCVISKDKKDELIKKLIR